MRVFQLVLTEQQVDVVFGALGMIQYNQSSPTIEAIKAQVANQVQSQKQAQIPKAKGEDKPSTENNAPKPKTARKK